MDARGVDLRNPTYHPDFGHESENFFTGRTKRVRLR